MPGIGLNRLWYVGGRYAYTAAHLDGFTDHMLVVVDVSEPLRPSIAGRWWLPGMWQGGGEVPGWGNRRVALHHMIVAGDRGYAAWRDGGFTILDVADVANIKLLSHVNTSPPFPGGTHTTLPLPGRKLAAVLDESNGLNCAGRPLLHLALRRARAGKPGFDCDAADAIRPILVPAGREFRAAQSVGEPAGGVPERKPAVRDVS